MLSGVSIPFTAIHQDVNNFPRSPTRNCASSPSVCKAPPHAFLWCFVSAARRPSFQELERDDRSLTFNTPLVRPLSPASPRSLKLEESGRSGVVPTTYSGRNRSPSASNPTLTLSLLWECPAAKNPKSPSKPRTPNRRRPPDTRWLVRLSPSQRGSHTTTRQKPPVLSVKKHPECLALTSARGPCVKKQRSPPVN